MGKFDLIDHEAYQSWRKQKLLWAEDESLFKVLELGDSKTSADEKAIIWERLDKVGFCIYQLPTGFVADKQWIINFGLRFGLQRLDSNLCADPDSISTIEVKKEGSGSRYIPYTDKPINWHTDGYYNAGDKQINALILHCESPAAEGGKNQIFDCERAYIELRDKDPRFITALSDPEAMCIPPNEVKGEQLRDWECGSVFSVNENSGELHMRYTARQRNIRWKQDETTLEAVTFLQKLLTSGENGVIQHQLKAGQGIICKNSLHTRSGFTDSEQQQRRYYRARYFDAIKIT